MKNRIVFSIVIMLLLVSCQDNSFRIINHKKPDLRVDFSLFQNAGCKSNGYDSYDCNEQSPLFKIGCNSIAKDDLLGGLTPNYPTVYCGHFVYQEFGIKLPPTECLTSTVRQNGADCARLVIFKDNNYLLIKNIDELKKLFAPVDSPEEALSFALAGTKNYAEYGQTRKNNYVYEVQKLEDTYVETIADGYIVHVFYTPGIGCGPFKTEAVAVKVTHDGQIEEINRTPVYRDPANDTLCAD